MTYLIKLKRSHNHYDVVTNSYFEDDIRRLHGLAAILDFSSS